MNLDEIRELEEMATLESRTPEQQARLDTLLKAYGLDANAELIVHRPKFTPMKWSFADEIQSKGRLNRLPKPPTENA